MSRERPGDAPRSRDRTVDSTADEPLLRTADVSHGFGNGGVLDGVSLAVQAGEVLSIIGPSGTGKTTLLRLLSLFHPPDSGTITVDGNDAWTRTQQDRLAARRRIGMVFQEPNLFDATVGRNVEYGLHVRRGWRARLGRWIERFRDSEPAPAVADTLSVVGLDDAVSRQVDSLSGGERQRVAFARALACDPDVLLLDEPTSDLDPRNTAVLEAAVETARDRGLGVVIATHDMQQAERVADRVAVVLDGRCIEIGPTDTVFSEPSDPRTRRFIDGELVY